MKPHFQDRPDAGAQLAGRLAAYAGRPDVTILALPRGGVPVARAVAARLGVPLDVLVVRKLGVPGHEELAMGAVAGGGVQVLNHDIVNSLGLDRVTIEQVAARERRELARRERAYRGDRPPAPVAGRTVILVDDGIATGATARAALAALRTRGADRLVVAAPTISPEAFRQLRSCADEVVAVIVPDAFQGVGEWYDNFTQTTDDEVRALLAPVAAS
ncbi:MAG: hypothetical protein JNG83_05870 [Opitutaceae bacterium]|nr:hypothetical protein [Opitutaceae bacterium]